eukprot:g79988.t1
MTMFILLLGMVTNHRSVSMSHPRNEYRFLQPLQALAGHSSVLGLGDEVVHVIVKEYRGLTGQMLCYDPQQGHEPGKVVTRRYLTELAIEFKKEIALAVIVSCR